MFEKRLCKSDILSKHAYNVTLPQVFKHFANKNQLPSLSVRGALVENGLNDFKWINKLLSVMLLLTLK